MILSRQTSTLVAVLLIAAAAWAFMPVPQSTMALEMPFSSFVGMWAIMMTAMMLPSFAPIATRYINLIDASQWVSLFALVTGYLSVQILTGFLAYLIQLAAQNIMRQSPAADVALAFLSFAIAGLYQFTPLKMRCLKKCRAPFSQLLKYAAWISEWRHFWVGAHHGAYCVGCYWVLMLAFAFGGIEITAMLFIAMLVAAEKLWTEGNWFSYTVGVIFLSLALAALIRPELAFIIHHPHTL